MNFRRLLEGKALTERLLAEINAHLFVGKATSWKIQSFPTRFGALPPTSFRWRNFKKVSDICPGRPGTAAS
jgi:hypothetical protein